MTTFKKIERIVSKIPKGKVTTYKEIGKELGSGQVYRAVGVALKKNPYAPLVPCHRVIKADGSIGGYKGKTSGKAIKEKIKLLRKEGIKVTNNKVDLKRYLLRF
ncbi:MGMT family protein [Candidatus Woesearchaeota archaeon]|nr:MGMT family protein [Candidatus Woesearchaeota archaeon]